MPEVLLQLVAAFAAFGAAACLTLVATDVFGKGWQSYEQRYVTDAVRTLDDMFLTIPPQHLIYLSVLAYIFVAMSVFAILLNVTLALVVGLVGLPLPKLLVTIYKRRRDRKFLLQLVEALTSISGSLKAGYSLPQAFELIQREMPNPIGQEFRLLNQETRLGVPLEDALEHLHDRMPSVDLDLVITSILISGEVGGNLTEVFDNIAHTIRERHRLEGKLKALTTQGKLQAVIVCLIPFFIAGGIYLFVPDIIRPVFETRTGWAFLALIVVLELMGIAVIRKIVRIDV